MSGSKHFDKIAWTVTALMLVVTILFMNGSALGLGMMAHTMGYENRLFDNTRVHTIDIVMDDWDDFIDHATSEEYYAASVVIDGEAYKNVGLRAKGNTSLSTVSSLGSERYSFKIEFDHYDNSKTYHGLDKLSLNNLIQDATMMKDYLTYTMMNEFGVASSLCSFVYITVNGEDWGLYLAVEGVEESFLERNYGSDYGELYKPDSMSFGGGRGNGKDFNMDDFLNQETSADGAGQDMTMPQVQDPGNSDASQMPGAFGGDTPQIPGMTQGEASNGGQAFSGGRGGFNIRIDEETIRAAFEKLGLDTSVLDGIDFENITMETVQSVLSSLDWDTIQALMQEVMGGGSFDPGNIGGAGGFDMGSSDVRLQYIDDNTDSYSNIWNNAKTDITAADQERLIQSLKKLSDGEELESVVDIEQVIRYFVVHNYVCNGDSYTGSMVHNYYLYEKDGRLAMIPWDYNLAFGTFQGGDAQSTVNTPIDAPVSGGSGEDRPMWNWILSDASYTALYHQYFSEFLSSVDIQSLIDNAYNLIKSYVEKDPTAFYTYEEFEAGVEAIRQFCALRSESISMQLENGETTTDMSYADASGLTLSDMGSMGMGGGSGGDMPDMGGNKGSFGGAESPDGGMPIKPDADANASSGWNTQGSSPTAPEELPQSGEASQNGEIPQSGEAPDMPEGFDQPQTQGGFDGQMPNMGGMPGSSDSAQMQGGFGGGFPGQSTGGAEAALSGNSGSADPAESSNQPSRDNLQMPGDSFFPASNGADQVTSTGTEWIWLAVSVLILGAGLLIAKRYHR